MQSRWGPEVAAHLQQVSDFSPGTCCGGRLDTESFAQRAQAVTERETKRCVQSDSADLLPDAALGSGC